MPPPAGHAGAWGETGAWHCSKKPGAAGADERRRAALLASLPPPKTPVPEHSSRADGKNCYGKEQRWQTWPSEPPLRRCAPEDPGDQGCTPYDLSTDIVRPISLGFRDYWASFHRCFAPQKGCSSTIVKVGQGNQFGQSTWDNFSRLDLNGGGCQTCICRQAMVDGIPHLQTAQSAGSTSPGLCTVYGQPVEPSQGQGWNGQGHHQHGSAATFAVNATPFANYPRVFVQCVGARYLVLRHPVLG